MKILIRSGLICKKIGMSQIFDANGTVIPVTMLLAGDNRVLEVKKYRHGAGVKLAAFNQNPNRISKSLTGIFSNSGICSTKKVKEFRMPDSHALPIGTFLSVHQFEVGQLVDVKGYSTGKGFAGAMKRHNFKGLGASHGVSVSHRSLGSTGQCQDPGKVFKGKKMPGHLGGFMATQKNLKVVAIDDKLKLIIIKGAVPGNGYVYISNTKKK